MDLRIIELSRFDMEVIDVLNEVEVDSAGEWGHRRVRGQVHGMSSIPTCNLARSK